MIEATWNGAVLAAAEDTQIVEGNHYFARSISDRVAFWRGVKISSQ